MALPQSAIWCVPNVWWSSISSAAHDLLTTMIANKNKQQEMSQDVCYKCNPTIMHTSLRQTNATVDLSPIHCCSNHLCSTLDTTSTIQSTSTSSIRENRRPRPSSNSDALVSTSSAPMLRPLPLDSSSDKSCDCSNLCVIWLSNYATKSHYPMAHTVMHLQWPTHPHAYLICKLFDSSILSHSIQCQVSTIPNCWDFVRHLFDWQMPWCSSHQTHRCGRIFPLSMHLVIPVCTHHPNAHIWDLR